MRRPVVGGPLGHGDEIAVGVGGGAGWKRLHDVGHGIARRREMSLQLGELLGSFIAQTTVLLGPWLERRIEL